MKSRVQMFLLSQTPAIAMEHENPCGGELSHTGKDILDQAAPS